MEFSEISKEPSIFSVAKIGIPAVIFPTIGIFKVFIALLFDDISLEIQFNIKKNTIYIEGELTDIILFRYFLYIISVENLQTQE